MSSATEQVRRREIAHFDELWGSLGEPSGDDRTTFRDEITPAHLPGGSPRGQTHLLAYDLLQRIGVAGKDVLDYGCGHAKWSVHLSQLGARVTGFDLSPAAVDYARRRARANGLSIRFDVADASALPYPSESFDIAVGIGVLHHVIKYPATGPELHRVLRPGGIAVFTEPLGQNPLIEAARLVTMRRERDAGDVIPTDESIREWARAFSEVRVEGQCLFAMAKRVLPGRLRLLGALQRLDDAVLDAVPALRRYCGESLVVLTK